jgi:hypothetical protein
VPGSWDWDTTERFWQGAEVLFLTMRLVLVAFGERLDAHFPGSFNVALSGLGAVYSR